MRSSERKLRKERDCVLFGRFTEGYLARPITDSPTGQIIPIPGKPPEVGCITQISDKDAHNAPQAEAAEVRKEKEK
jgi:hypothetical protein